MNTIANVKLQNLKLFNSMLANDEYWIELLVFDCKTWEHLTVCKQMINVR